MKPPDEIRREIVAQWVARADEDLSVARHLLAEKLPYHGAIGFHAQQAAEKLLKAYLVAHQVEFPETHGLGRLLDLIVPVDGDRPSIPVSPIRNQRRQNRWSVIGIGSNGGGGYYASVSYDSS
jgi:hypothetical protein